MDFNIAVGGSKGGTGKTSLSINLIRPLGVRHVVDADPHTGISDILALNPDPGAIPTFQAIQSAKELERLLKNKTGILVDCGGFDSDVNREALINADVIIYPTNDDPTEQKGLSDFNGLLQYLSDKSGKKIIAHAVITRVHPSRNRFDDYIAGINEMSNMKAFPVVIPSSARVVAAMFSGSGVKSGTIAAKYSLLAKHIMEAALK
ncbi:hypothetical protein [Shewanella algae]|uniref:ParA family protein n=1 Tax=Shewanella algae TaxID=38313 RepID=UPI0031F4FDAD